MCKKLISRLSGILLLAAAAPASYALPIVSIDLDPTTPGIQTTLSVDAGTSFTIDMMVTGDGTPFDLAIFETVFNSSGAVLGLAAGSGAPTAGSLSALGAGAFDVYAGTPLIPGAPMSTSAGPPFAPTPGFAGQSGGIGMFLLGGPPVLGDFSFYSLTFNALIAGSSDLAPSAGSGLPFEGGLGFFGGPLLFATVGATVTVNDTGALIPEPSILALFGLGLLSLGRLAGRRR